METKKSVPERLRTNVPAATEPEVKTPTRSSFLDVTNDEQSTPENSPPHPAKSESELASERMTVSVPSISVGPTEDSDTDFQSAYSAGSRGSYGSFESGKTKLENNDDAVLLSQSVPENHEERFSAIPKTRRERVSSTATATTKREKSEPRSSLTTAAPLSRSRITTK